MKITVEKGTNYDTAYGETKAYDFVRELYVEANGVKKSLGRWSVGDFRHKKHGCLLTINANIFHNEPHITVETASEDVDEFGYHQWNEGMGEDGAFVSFDALERWLNANAELVMDE